MDPRYRNFATTLVVGGLGCMALYIVYTKFIKPRYSGYTRLGSPFLPSYRGSKRELNEECLEHPGYRMCTLTDGTSGVCGTSGICMADLMMDNRDTSSGENIDDIIAPRCLQPTFKEGCNRFCECKIIKGDVFEHDFDGCVQDCRSYYYPA